MISMYDALGRRGSPTIDVDVCLYGYECLRKYQNHAPLIYRLEASNAFCYSTPGGLVTGRLVSQSLTVPLICVYICMYVYTISHITRL